MSDAVATPSFRTNLDGRYNLFRRKEEPDLYCAAPEDRPVPHFLNAGDWAFDGTASGPGSAPPGFNGAAARIGVRFNGFHLFLAHGVPARAEARRSSPIRTASFPVSLPASAAGSGAREGNPRTKPLVFSVTP